MTWSRVRRWLTPGLGVKRWLVVLFAGLLILAVGVAHALRQIAQDVEPGTPVATILDVATLQFLPYALRGLVLAVVGIGLVALGGYRVLRVVTDPLRPSGPEQPLAEVLYQRRQLARGPRVVAIGGGTGLSALLRGLKEHTSNLTAVVTVADDGGSSGVLRAGLGIPAVGDIRNCIAALADSESHMRDLLQYRFPVEDGVAADQTGLGGHAVGNLLLAAMTAIEGGDFEEAVRRVNRILAVRGQVVPVSGTPLTLHARCADGTVVDGQSSIMRTANIERVWMTPAEVAPSDDAIEAIRDAELVVLGPGSLFTSLLPSLLVPAIRDAVRSTTAVRMYVCNVATQDGETAGMGLAAHLDRLYAHTAPDIIDVVLVNDRFDARVPPTWAGQAVSIDWTPPEPGPRLVRADVVDPDNAHHHDPDHLAAAVLTAFDDEIERRRRA